MSGRSCLVLIAVSLLANTGCQTGRRGAPAAGRDLGAAPSPLPTAAAQAGPAGAGTEVPAAAVAVWSQPESPTRRIPVPSRVYLDRVPVEAIFGEIGMGGVPQSVEDVEILNRRPSRTAPLPAAGVPAGEAVTVVETTGAQVLPPTIPTFAEYVRWLEGSGLRYSIPGEQAPAAAAPAAGELAETITAGQPYTVRKGDSLWVIARRAYGDGNQWRRIFDANQPSLREAADLRPGTVLQIP